MTKLGITPEDGQFSGWLMTYHLMQIAGLANSLSLFLSLSPLPPLSPISSLSLSLSVLSLTPSKETKKFEPIELVS